MTMEGASATSDTGVARFSPNLPGRGKYFVYATWPRAANADPGTWVIKHRTGEEIKKIPQDGWGAYGTQNGEIWHQLGQFEFNKGPDQYVEVRGEPGIERPDKRNWGQLYADGVMFSREPLNAPRSTTAGKTAKPAANGSQSAPARLTWLDEIDTALAVAGKDNRKILIFFYTPESEASQHYQNVVFENSDVKSALSEGYVLARINFTTNASRASQLGVFKAGTIVVYNSKGQPLARIDGRRTADEVIAELGKL